ncbi:MAG TPA: hypothetical protein VK028_14020, partial [Micromonosporaceae bacterium]|nr:hypothetical protein [Micromonosporaceae bacterium]
MSAVLDGARTYRQRLGDWLQAGRLKLRRISAGVLLVRSLAGVAAVVAGVLAVAPELLADPRALGVTVFGGLGVGLLPRTRWVTLYALAVICVWTVGMVVRDDPGEIWRIGGIAAALYVMHTSAALAAVLPYDTVLTSGVLSAWARRTTAVLAAGLVPGLGLLVMLRELPSVGTWVGPV